MSVLLSRKLANPTYFPGLPTIWRERLLHARRLGRDVEPEIAHQNGSAFEVFLIEKLAAIVGKLARYRRQAKSPLIKGHQKNTPPTGCGVVVSERLRLNAECLVGASSTE